MNYKKNREPSAKREVKPEKAEVKAAVKEKNPGQCPLYKKCGGCQLQNLSYAQQLLWKQRLCVRLLGSFCHVREIIGMENPFHYRNKVQAAFGTDRRGKIISGIYQSSTHRIVPVDSCMTEDIKADEIICSVRKLIGDFKLTAYDEVSGRGFLRHVLVKRGFSTGEIMVVLVCSTPVFTAKNHFVKALLQLHPEISTIVMNINDRYGSMVLGKNEKILHGKGYITDILCGCRFRISPKSFYQINPVQTEILYSKAVEFAELTGSELVLDAYCGTGTIGIIAAKSAGQVLGVELNADAVKDAVSNYKENGIKNIRFVCADAGEFMRDMARAVTQGEFGEDLFLSDPAACDVVFMDPPRAGSDETFLASLCLLAPKRLVYISCNPETLARDLHYLVKNGYAVKAIQPVDMFPHTNHVECVCLLTQSK